MDDAITIRELASTFNRENPPAAKHATGNHRQVVFTSMIVTFLRGRNVNTLGDLRRFIKDNGRPTSQTDRLPPFWVGTYFRTRPAIRGVLVRFLDWCKV